MSGTRYLFDLQMPPVYLGETVAVMTAHNDVQIAYEETLTWDLGAAIGLVRVETGTLALIDDLYRWWRLKQRAMGFPFQLSVRVGNRTRADFVTHTPDQLQALIAENQELMIARLTEGEVGIPR
jgi:hypothetical protein